jgi:hypothetical protein
LAVTPAAPAFAADCTSGGQAAARVLTLDDPEVGTRMLVNLGVWLGLVEKDLEADLRKTAGACERGEFEAASTSYVLHGEDDADAVPRVAAPRSERAPRAYLIPAVDLQAALHQADKSKPAPIAGYALMTVDGGMHTAWRAYDAVPADAVLLADMREALSGKLRPRLQWRGGGEIRIITPPATR